MTAAQILSDQALPFSDFPTEILRIAGRDIEVLVLNDDKNMAYEEGGSFNDPIILVAAERSQFEHSGVRLPVEGMRGFAFRRKSYRIGTVKCDDDLSSIRFELISEEK